MSQQCGVYSRVKRCIFFVVEGLWIILSPAKNHLSLSIVNERPSWFAWFKAFKSETYVTSLGFSSCCSKSCQQEFDWMMGWDLDQRFQFLHQISKVKMVQNGFSDIIFLCFQGTRFFTAFDTENHVCWLCLWIIQGTIPKNHLKKLVRMELIILKPSNWSQMFYRAQRLEDIVFGEQNTVWAAIPF